MYKQQFQINLVLLVVQLVNEEGCLLKGDPWPCLLDGLPSSEGRASAYKAEGRWFNPSGSPLFLRLFSPIVD